MEENQEFQNDQMGVDIDEQFILSPTKFIILSLVTFNFYPLWWIYKEWNFFRQKESSDILPAVRALFSIFYLIPLFSKILHGALEKGYQKKFNPVLLFLCLIVANILAYLPDPFWMVSFLGTAFFIPVLEASNYAKQNSTEFKATELNSFNSKQIVLIILGTLFWVLILYGLTLNEI